MERKLLRGERLVTRQVEEVLQGLREQRQAATLGIELTRAV
jgi:hypothetical protein